MYYVLHGAAHAAATAATAAPAPGLCSLRRRWHYTTLCYVVLALVGVVVYVVERLGHTTPPAPAGDAGALAADCGGSMAAALL